MEKLISKEEFDELMNIEGQGVGITLRAGAEFILKEIGKEGVKKLEDAMEQFGVSIKYKNIKSMKFYPLGLSNVSLVLTKKLFNFDDEKFKEFGKFVASSPLFVRRHTAWNIFSLAMRKLFSAERLAKETAKLWRRYYTVGDFEMVELNQEKKYVIYRLKNFPLNAIYCKVFEGNLFVLSKMVFKGLVTCEETKCVYRGDEYHEFLVRW